VDLAIEDNGQDYLFEMKYWWEGSSARVNSDIRRLRSSADGGGLLVFSANPADPKTLTDNAIQYLIDQSPPPKLGQPVDCYRFGTKSPMGRPSEFWFAGWQIPQVSAGQRSTFTTMVT